jgi:NADPH:quinone reductase-like Zn-dependent oxidoreductase
LFLPDPHGSPTGKTLLLIGAAGGVGSFTTPLANAGAQVIAIARDDAADRLRAYGAEEVLDYAEAVVSEQIVAPPITRIGLGDVAKLNANPNTEGKTVIVP